MGCRFGLGGYCVFDVPAQCPSSLATIVPATCPDASQQCCIATTGSLPNCESFEFGVCVTDVATECIGTSFVVAGVCPSELDVCCAIQN